MAESMLLNSIAKRNRQRTVIFSPNAYDEEPKKDGRGRKKSLDGQQAKPVQNIWKNYKSKMNVLVRIFGRELHCLNVYKQDQYESPDVQLCEDKIKRIKEEIYELFEKIAAENANDKVWSSLLGGEGRAVGDPVSVEEIYCSKCLLDVEEGDLTNDILLCDRKGCGRAYHQKCLDPPIVFGENHDPADDWFCWQCDCLDACLDNVNEVMETSVTDWKNLFPELRHPDYDTVLSTLAKGGGDDDSDDDYKPTRKGKKRKAKKQSKSKGKSDGDSDENDGDDENENDASAKSGSSSGSSSGSGSGSGSDDSTSEHDGDDSVDSSGSDVEVDTEEVAGLLLDVEKDKAGSAMEIIADAARSPTSGPSHHVKKRKAASRRKNRRTPVKPKGPKDLGKTVARVIRGVLAFGKIVSFVPGEGSKEMEAGDKLSAITVKSEIANEELVESSEVNAVKNETDNGEVVDAATSLEEAIASDSLASDLAAVDKIIAEDEAVAASESKALENSSSSDGNLAPFSAEGISEEVGGDQKADDPVAEGVETTGDEQVIKKEEEEPEEEVELGRLTTGVWIVRFDDSTELEYDYDEIKCALLPCF